VLVDDCTPDKHIQGYLAALKKRERPDLLIIHRQVNGGFSEAVNIGMLIAGDGDVILLNADTVVQSGWVDRLVAAAQSDAHIATVTPLSNNGEICNIPYIGQSLPVTEASLAIEIDTAAATVNTAKRVDIPVAIGFCMLIRRTCLDEIGLFDAAMWGRGYGEEVDFCIKAAARGWRHVMAADCFVVHRGNVFFGAEKAERINVSAQQITALYPFYDQTIKRFLKTDPGLAVRRAVNLELINNNLPSRRILHISHNFGGGTEQYIKGSESLNIAEGLVPFILRYNHEGAAELEVNLAGNRLCGFFNEHHTEHYKEHDVEGLKADISKLGFAHLHIHAPFGVPYALLDWLSLTYPFTLTIHDYAWICPRVNLTTSAGQYCNEPPVAQCNQCVKLYQPFPELSHFVEDVAGDIAAYRDRFATIIARAETVLAGANDVVQRMQHHGIQGEYQAVAHPVVKGSVFAKTGAVSNQGLETGLITVALLGVLSDIKGFYVLLECAGYAYKKKLPLRFVVFGFTANDALCLALPNIEIVGRYKEEDLDKLVQSYRPHLSFFPNQVPETFSYTLSHAFRLGLWPVVTDIGAPAERVKASGFGGVYDRLNTPEQICDLLLEQALLI
jgi:glycosyltransferase involved in cell wall biosynthesis